MSDPLDFTDRHVFVAGGTSGINLGIAEGFARRGARLAVLSRSQDKVDAAVAKLVDLGAEAAGFAADVRDADAVASALQAAADRFGPIDVLVSGAAGNFPAPATGMSANGFKSVVDIDLLGSFHVLRAAHPLLARPGGCAINISAPQAFMPMALQAHVCAAKAGVDMLTRVLAMEWGPEGLRVNSIVPGPIDGTEGMARLAPGASARKMVERTVPMGRMGTVEDVANCALLLASPLAGYISGQVLAVDGGWSLSGASQAMGAMAMAFAGKAKGAEKAS